MKRSILGLLNFILIVFILLGMYIVFDKLGITAYIKNYILEQVLFPRQCKYAYPIIYKQMIYDVCSLNLHNISYDDLKVLTNYNYENKTCTIDIYIKNNKILSYTGKMGSAFIVNCTELLKYIK